MSLNLAGALYLELGHLLSTPPGFRCTTDDLPRVLTAAREMTSAGGPAALPMTATYRSVRTVNKL